MMRFRLISTIHVHRKPYLPLTRREFDERYRRARWRIRFWAMLSICLVLVGMARDLGPLEWGGIWSLICAVIVIFAAFPLGFYQIHRLERRFGLACPSCGAGLVLPYSMRSHPHRSNVFTNGGICSQCRERIIEG